MSKLKRKIKEGVRKDSGSLLESLLTESANEDLIKDSVASIGTLIQIEKGLQEDRKKLSRQIGVLRKRGEDTAELIAGVSEISEKIKQLDTDIDHQVAQIENCLNQGKSAAGDPPSAAQLDVPAHLALVEQALDCDANQLQLGCEPGLDESEWQAFVDSQTHATVYHDARWHKLIKDNFGHNPQYITCRKPDGSLCGVFPTVHLNSRLFGSFLVSMPYFNYGGPLTSYPEAAQKMMQYAAEIGTSLECTHLESRDTLQRDPWLCKQHKITMILPLPETDEQLDQQLGTKVRAQVKRAAREDLEFVAGGAELLPEFYRVFAHNMRDLGTPVYSRKFFASILESFPGQASLTIVRHEGEPVAAGFLLGYNDKLEIPWASSLRRANPLGANMFMYRQILRSAIERKYQYFDFGRSSKGASTHKFKKQWGALEHPLYWHYWLRDSGELPELNPNNPKYKLVISAWQKLPVAVANIIGPTLVRNLP